MKFWGPQLFTWLPSLASLLFLPCVPHSSTLVAASRQYRHAVDKIEDFGPVEKLNALHLQRRQSSVNGTFGSTYAITGIGQYGISPRQEIRVLQQNPDQFNLYILALQKMMQTDENDLLSHYSIAGIHGRPFVPWGNLSVKGVLTGYCHHTSNIFLPWHRPYMLLYEQVLHSLMVGVVNTFPAGPTRDRYAQAALEWRLPYWDWAMDPPDSNGMLPSIVQQPVIQVTFPNGTANITNPLYAYSFHPSAPVAAFYWTPYNEWPTSIRAPNNLTAQAASQDNVANENLYALQTMLKDRIYGLFTNYNNFTQFGNQAEENHDAQHSDSLEKVHNVVHDKSGSQGTMTFLEFSAHDPLFFLHHAFVDRCFALWQALYPDSFVEPMAALEDTMMTLTGETIDAKTPLWPFSTDTNSTWFTSESVRDWKRWGYTYPELQDGYTQDSVRSQINLLYGNSASTGVLTRREINEDRLSEDDVPGWLVDGKRSEYAINVEIDKSAVNGTFTIYFFLGEFDESNPSCWPTEASLVGVDSAFGPFRNSFFVDELRRSVKVSGSVPLTSKLLGKVEMGELCSMEDSEGDGTEIKVDQAAGLNVSVIANEVTPACSPNEFPAWGTVRALRNITKGKLAGASADQA